MGFQKSQSFVYLEKQFAWYHQDFVNNNKLTSKYLLLGNVRFLALVGDILP